MYSFYEVISYYVVLWYNIISVHVKRHTLQLSDKLSYSLGLQSRPEGQYPRNVAHIISYHHFIKQILLYRELRVDTYKAQTRRCDPNALLNKKAFKNGRCFFAYRITNHSNAHPRLRVMRNKCDNVRTCLQASPVVWFICSPSSESSDALSQWHWNILPTLRTPVFNGSGCFKAEVFIILRWLEVVKCLSALRVAHRAFLTRRDRRHSCVVSLSPPLEIKPIINRGGTVVGKFV